MVTVFLRGGLGNQMFQYAFGLNIAKKNGTELLLDTVHVRDRFPRPNFTYRTFDLDIFTLTPRFTILSRAANWLPLPGVWLGADLFTMNIKERFGGHTILYEDERKGFDPRVLAARGDLILYGRWEDEKYFADSADDVRAAFRFRYPLEGPAAKIALAIRSTNSVSLHVRRGDFVRSKKVKGIMGDTNLPYYEKAIAYMAARVRDPHFFIFSDDVAWCKENVNTGFPTTYLENDTAGPKASGHLELMSRCRHNVTANSTFSWWGAWLNANPGKIVVAPQKWFNGANGSVKDIIPKGWTTL
jgi:hypothetical protein